MDAAFTQDAKLTPFWWEAAPPYDTPLDALPRKVDVLIVGSGYTGLHAAIELARGDGRFSSAIAGSSAMAVPRAMAGRFPPP